MIPNIVFVSLKFFFLALLYIFLILVVRAIYRDARAPAAETKGRSARRRKKARPHLLVIAAERNLGSRCYLADETIIGRAPESNIVLDDTYASQQHAVVLAQQDSYFIEDLGSTNGTYVNGRRISYPLELRQGDRIKIGKTVFEFQV